MGIRKEIKAVLFNHDVRDGGNNTVNAIEKILKRPAVPKPKVEVAAAPDLIVTVADDTVRLHYSCELPELILVRRALNDLIDKLLDGALDEVCDGK